ncbi:DUF3558 family protein [Corynebacterium lizhenjunii]|uniref:DUF3558 family protein n=1 Tax=Corynebacterium lizhenjunii TaxID=2709394 RepID=UPI0013EAAAB6|nr:DUF3558 family protein [Corynebacterium lizhenjunii]
MRKQFWISVSALVGVAGVLVGCSQSVATSSDTAAGVVAAPAAASEQVVGEGAESVAPKFEMPPPGPFDPNAPGYKPFKPCEDIPDEVLAKIGVRKETGVGERLDPYGCPVEMELVKGRGVMALLAFPSTAEELVQSGLFQLSEERGARISGSAVLDHYWLDEEGYCVSGVDTTFGFIGVDYGSTGNIPSGASMCEVPTKIMEELYGKEQ